MNLKDLIKITKIKKLKFSQIDLDNKNIGGGIYRMFDHANEVIYVGKSSDLRKRVMAHIGLDTHISHIMNEVKKIEWLAEQSPIFQSLLETIFIAFHQPKHNDEIKDTKRKFGEIR